MGLISDNFISNVNLHDYVYILFEDGTFISGKVTYIDKKEFELEISPNEKRAYKLSIIGKYEFLIGSSKVSNYTKEIKDYYNKIINSPRIEIDFNIKISELVNKSIKSSDDLAIYNSYNFVLKNSPNEISPKSDRFLKWVNILKASLKTTNRSSTNELLAKLYIHVYDYNSCFVHLFNASHFTLGLNLISKLEASMNLIIEVVSTHNKNFSISDFEILTKELISLNNSELIIRFITNANYDYNFRFQLLLLFLLKEFSLNLSLPDNLNFFSPKNFDYLLTYFFEKFPNLKNNITSSIDNNKKLDNELSNDTDTILTSKVISYNPFSGKGTLYDGYSFVVSPKDFPNLSVTSVVKYIKLKEHKTPNDPTAKIIQFLINEKNLDTNKTLQNPNYYQLAKEALLNKATKEDIISKFGDAINKSSQKYSSIMELYNYYLEINEPDNAESLIINNKVAIPEKKYYHALRGVYEKNKNYPKNIEIIDTILSKFSSEINTNEIYSKYDLLFRKAYLLLYFLKDIKSGKHTLQTIEERIKFIENKIRKEVLISYKVRIYSYNAMIEFSLGNTSLANKHAQEAILLNPNDRISNAIINSTFEFEKYENTDENYSLNDRYSDFTLTDLMESRIDNFNLEETIDKSKLENGKFIVNLEEANKIIKKLVYSDNDNKIALKQKRDNYISAAKITRDLGLNGNEDKKKQYRFIDDKNIIDFVAKAISFDADIKFFSESQSLNSCRFLFFQCIIYLENFNDSFTKYFFSYLPNARTSLEKEIDYLNNSYKKDSTNKVNSEFFYKFKDYFALASPELIIGLFWFRDYRTSIYNAFLESYNRYDEIKIAVNNSLKHYNVETLDHLLKQFESFIDNLDDFSNESKNLFNIQYSSEQFHSKFTLLFNNPFMSEDDQNLLDNLVRFRDSLDRDFNNIKLGDAIQELIETKLQITKVIENIKLEPTLLSYEFLLDFGEALLKQSTSELSNYYKRGIPEIEVDLNSNVIYIDSNKDYSLLQVGIKNKMGKLPIKDFVIESISPDIKIDQEYQSNFNSLKEGESKTIIFKFFITKEMIVSKTISLKLKVSYRYEKKEYEYENTFFIKDLSLNILSSDKFAEIENPYSLISGGEPLKGDKSKLFYGRTDLLKDLYSNYVKNSSGLVYSQAAIIHGQKRSGKTSVSNQLQELIFKKSKETIVIDFGSVAMWFEPSITSIQIIKEILFKRIYKEIMKSLEKPDFSRLKQKLLNKSSAYVNLDFNFDPSKENIMDKFLDFHEDLFEAIINDFNIVIFIDEFTEFFYRIKDYELLGSFTEFWKALLQQTKFSYIIVAQDSIEKFITAFPNSFNSIKKIRLGYLAFQEAHDFIDKPILIYEEKGKIKIAHSRFRGNNLIINRIIELTAGNPFFTAKFCDQLVRYLNRRKTPFVNEYDINEIKDELINGSQALDENSFESLFQDDSVDMNLREKRRENNIKLLTTIAKLSMEPDGYCNIDDIKKVSLFAQIETEQLCQDLEYRSVLERKGNSYKIKVALFKDFLVNKYGK
jgi:hypothetical protein